MYCYICKWALAHPNNPYGIIYCYICIVIYVLLYMYCYICKWAKAHPNNPYGIIYCYSLY